MQEKQKPFFGPQDEGYGSVYRKCMMRSMKEPWQPKNRVQRTGKDPIFYWGSWIVGTLAVLFVAATVLAQIYIHMVKS